MRETEAEREERLQRRPGELFAVPKFVTPFPGSVPPGGYVWDDVRVAGRSAAFAPVRALVDAPPPPTPAMADAAERTDCFDVSDQHAHRPLPSELFLTFARLPKSEEATLAFANQWGQLGVGVAVEPGPDPGPDLAPTRYGERWDEWVTQIDRMRKAVRLWRAVAGGQPFAGRGTKLVDGTEPTMPP